MTLPIIGGDIADGQPPPNYIPTDQSRDIVSFDQDAFDNAIAQHGIRFLHFRAMRCPIGMLDVTDIRKGHQDHSGCSHGFLYTLAGEIDAVFANNNGQGNKQAPVGIVSDSTVSITPPRHYNNTKTPFYATQYDRLYLTEPGILVCNWELLKVDEKSVGKAAFPIDTVIDLVDSAGNRYVVNRDFTIVKGRISWIAALPFTGAAIVLGIRYLYRPYWYVTSLPHEVRVARVDLADGSSGMARQPMHLALQREYLFESELPEVETTTAPLTTARTAPAPSKYLR